MTLAIDLAGLTKPSQVTSLIRTVLKDYPVFSLGEMAGEIEVKTSRTTLTPELALKRADNLWREVAEDMGMVDVKELPNKQVVTLDARATFQALTQQSHAQVKNLQFGNPPNITDTVANLEAVQQLEQVMQLGVIFSKLNNPRVYEVTGDLGFVEEGKILLVCGEFTDIVTGKNSTIICESLIGIPS